MKNTILILLVFVGFAASSQITTELTTEKKFIRNEWRPIQTIEAVQGEKVEKDVIRYTLSSDLPELLFRRVRSETIVKGDSIFEFTKTINADVYTSRKVVVNQLVKVYAITPVEKTNDAKLIELLIKAKQLKVTDNAFFWNYPEVSVLLPKVEIEKDTIK